MELNLISSVILRPLASKPPSTVTVNQGDASNVTFTQATGGYQCPSGDQSSARTTENTVSGTQHKWCALANVQGQLGDLSSSTIVYTELGGLTTDYFGWSGA